MSGIAALAIAALALGTPVACATVTAPQDPTAASMVFCSDRDGGVFRLHRMGADGGGVRALIPRSADAVADEHRNPSAAPSGKAIVFENIRDGRGDLFVLDLATSSARRLTNTGVDSQPHWSADGSRIIFRSLRDGDSAIFVCLADGSDVRRLSPLGAQDRWPRWSPDGRTIAFTSIASGVENVWLMDADGTDRRQLTRSRGTQSRPSWSPNGASLVCHATTSASGKHDGIYRMDVERGELTKMQGGSALQTKYMDRNTASWGAKVSPGGNRILFVSTRSGNAEIYRMDRNGNDTGNLTNHSSQDDMAIWLPR